MPTIIENINNIISTKSELKTILTENGLEPSENFNEYPDMFRSIVGGGSIDEAALNGYISSYLDTYSFIDQTALSANSYVTSADLSAYATKSYVVDYVATYAVGGNATIDENIIPKSNNTYSLGNSSYIYKTAYVTDLWTSQHNRISNGGDNEIGIQINHDWIYLFHTETFSPATNNITLGTYTNKWANTYTSYLYCDINGVSTDIGYYLSYNINGGSDMSDYLPLTGGEITGPLYVSYQQTNNALYGFKSYSHIVAGDENKTTPAFLASKRYCANGVGSYINMASFFVNGDGRAKFAHKSTAGGGSDDAFMCFNAYGFKLAYSGAAGTAASTEYDLIHSGNISEYAGVTNESIIPKENNTYTLGDSTYQYASVNTYSVGAYNSNMYIDTAHGIGFNINGSNRIYIGNSQFRPLTDNLMNLGLSSANWKATYTYSLYLNGTEIRDSINGMFSYDSTTGILTITTL